ncbi:hypothetical protein KZZ52_55595 [Dactylosporangium sp. AC04546]|uniref:DUF3592 domain-containing protein n=1 Tax=Dactylosporangium sp. AC04546 TaxID=2862460 RepID=UPI001EE0C21F|nr:DUF3592 domain-containing protein [Dactylosporangium sp. AC04546]WVK83052.1 hypothetical protein KZZ52_55595 [Dactylosporangium sp. AC04546]
MVKRYRRRLQATRSWPTGEAGPDRPEPRSRWRPGYWLRHPALGVAFCALLVSATVYCGLGNLRHRNAMLDRGEWTAGTVRELHDGQWWASVTFTTRSGEEVTTWISHAPWSSPSVGEEVDVLYDPLDPVGTAYLSGDEPGLRDPLLLLGAAGVLALLFAWRLRRTWRRLRGEAESWRHREPVPRLLARRRW